MNVFRKIVPLVVVVTAILISFAYQADAIAPGPMVSMPGNKHNLSSSNVTNPYHATTADTRGLQICIFCHTPHSANVAEQAPLWNRNFSSQIFQRYTGSATFKIKNITDAQYGPVGQPNYVTGAQPNGSSKLCLSCHDGVSKLGAVYKGPEIPMTVGVISGIASFKPSTNKMRYGHHPVSFVYATNFSSLNDNKLVQASQSGTVIGGLPADYVFPQSIDGKVTVKLKDTFNNGNGWMQCTTCHDAHMNQSDDDDCYGGACGDGIHKKSPFWVYHKAGNTATQDHDAVCTACHSLSLPPVPAQWPQ
jgi:cytochrome c553